MALRDMQKRFQQQEEDAQFMHDLVKK